MAEHPTIAPHPSTRDLKPLEVPPLDGTLDAYQHALAAVLDGPELEHAREDVEHFRTGAGPRLDAALRERAEKRSAQGTNWLHNEWYSGYLTVREPLTLSTNVAFQLALPLEQTPAGHAPMGLDRAVEFIRRAATVHLQVASRNIPEDVDARGNRITLNQWFVYAVSTRLPLGDEDQIFQSRLDETNREIGVFVNGRLFAVPLTDSAGALVSAEALRAALEAIQAAATEPAAIDFNAPSLLGSGVLEDLMVTIIEQGLNHRVYDRLGDMLFTVELLTDNDATDAQRMREATFTPRGAWVYKPLSYQVSLHDNWTAVNVEHSCIDGATLLTAMQRIQTAELPTEASTELTQLEAEELVWTLDEDTAAEIRKLAGAYAERASKFTVQIITAPHRPPADMPFKFSRDAAAQLTMTIAQQLTYGRIRAVYEAVDMREYRAGRTECLRAATPEAAAFAQKLVAGTATHDDLLAAANAHRSWVKRCKSGNGFDRHIQMMATIDASDPFFTDDAVLAVRRDFLSTTSVGGPQQIVRYSFAPTVPEGFGISYTPLPEATEFCVSWNIDTAEKPEEFTANLVKAAEMLWDFLDQEEFLQR
ncbi:choline/carnitine O-acyltransferase [Pseudoglutamicibacter cumminsii]|uniref:choline/carnitine O-acyltransferase n=1 Tax=Pseudoglutamicibacter cumminsii TaxID=156979 RepID=UPI002554C3DF|nr:choline/carnitine O-acyltransferase [Pseudoglutamicibacter cumminsii]MDK7083037.1 choline/carnitine O-acyltransferase [Pseudoglutamicibacter cumminsii]